MQFKNVSPLGALEIPMISHEPIAAGAKFDVPDELGELFAAQPDNYEPIDKAAKDAVAALAARTAAPTIETEEPASNGGESEGV